MCCSQTGACDSSRMGSIGWCGGRSGRRRGAMSSPPIRCEDLFPRQLVDWIMLLNLMNKPVVHGARRCLILAGLSVVAGCSWKTPSPADYVPDEGPTEAWIIATPNPVPLGRGPGKTIVNWHTGDG